MEYTVTSIDVNVNDIGIDGSSSLEYLLFTDVDDENNVNDP
jgi:hypothetical protein